jgi:hypothetical protein
MLKKIIVFTLLSLIPLMCLTSTTYASSLDDLVASMDSVCDISIGNNLDLLEQAFTKEPYALQWKLASKITNPKASLIYDPIYRASTPFYEEDGGYDITSRLYVYADNNRTIGRITYDMRYRTNGIYYSSNLKYLIKIATNKFGTPVDSMEKINGHVAQVKTWTVGKRTLIITTYNETYDRDHPYWISITRT